MMNPTSPQEDPDETNDTHLQMHDMMDSLMGEGFSEKMHTTMSGSEEMMEQCVSMMYMMQNMQGMMDNMDGMDDMMDSGGKMDRNAPDGPDVGALEGNRRKG